MGLSRHYWGKKSTAMFIIVNVNLTVFQYGRYPQRENVGKLEVLIFSNAGF